MHRAGELMLLRPEQGLKDPERAAASLRHVLAYERLQALLLGEGWCVFRDGRKLLEAFLASLKRTKRGAGRSPQRGISVGKKRTSHAAASRVASSQSC